MSDTATCRRVVCCGVNGVQFNDFIYSLVLGESYTNPELSFTINCPPGYDCTADSVVVVIPPGTIKFTPTVLDPNPPNSGSGDPWNPISGTYNFDCGSETLTIRTDGTGFTNDQIDQIINFLAQCQANKDGYDELLPTPIFTPSGAPGIRLWNTEQSCTATCPEGETGDPVTVTIPANTNSTIIAASSTPLERYLAQQALNTAAYDQACAQAESELACAGPECPSLLDTISVGGGICVQAAYDPIGNTLFFTNFSSSVVVQIDPVTNSVLSSTPIPAQPAGIVYVPGPTVVSADPAMIIAALDGNLYHMDVATLTVTLLGALTAASAANAAAYSNISDKVFIPIATPTGGLDVYTVSTGALTHIAGDNQTATSMVYNADLNEIYCNNFNPTAYPGVDLLGVDAASNAVVKQCTLSLPAITTGANRIAYASSVGKIFITERSSSTLANLFVVDAATFVEEFVVDIATGSSFIIPTAHFNPAMSIVLVGITQSTLLTNSINIYNPIDDSLICSIAALNTVGRGAVAANGSLYIQIRSSTADLQIGQIGPTP